MRKPAFISSFTALVLAALLAGSHAHAQRSQALCKDLLDALDAGTETGDHEIDNVGCVSFAGRMYANTALDGIEEDAIIGVGTADVTLDHDDLTDLATTRVVLAQAAGAGKFFFIDWAVVLKTGSAAIPAGGASATLGIDVAPAMGGVHDSIPAISVTGTGFGAGVFDTGDTFIRRFRPSRIGVGVASIADTPIVAAVTSDATAWDAAVAQIENTAEVRIIVRYRIIDTTDRF